MSLVQVSSIATIPYKKSSPAASNLGSAMLQHPAFLLQGMRKALYM